MKVRESAFSKALDSEYEAAMIDTSRAADGKITFPTDQKGDQERLLK